LADGTVEAGERKNLTAANISHVAASGTYCFHGLSFTPRSAMVTGHNFGAVNNTLASASIRRGGLLDNCNPAVDIVRVRTAVSNTGVLADRSFIIWFET